jgi:urease accessory protein
VSALELDSPSALLATLQHADSFFPAGGVAFSWGLEGLVTDGMLRAERDLSGLVVGHMRQRWAVFDRGVLVAAYEAACDLDAVAATDRRVDAMILARELREGSRRAGASLLSVHERLGTPGSAAYRTMCRAGLAPGHQPIVQGLVWRGAGMTLEQAQVVSAHTFCVSLLGALLRLGTIGHLAAQETLTAARATTAQLLQRSVPPLEECYTYTPLTEIAAMRHEVQSARLFAN